MNQRNLIKSKVLYISYDGLMEPLSQSQVLAYLKKLAKDYGIYLVTYEKPSDWHNTENRKRIKDAVSSAGINWFPLRYHKTPRLSATLYDLAIGFLLCIYLVLRYRIKIAHGRNTVPSILAFFMKKIFGIRFIFDYRGFWADERKES
ncbi:MAG: glycosyltransferase, partial [Candidatus Omnitrophica bacterium]|nr:glycosyltransferase [Candidatus Omnitrophota bacterium]